jgi:hypothetical protein
MLTYLDQIQSIGPDSPAAQFQRRGGARGVGGFQPAVQRTAGLNENLAREIMELHTVGVNGGYSQADVTEFARAMTGLSIGGERDGGTYGLAAFRAQAHEPGARTVMGVRYDQRGKEQAAAILSDLAAKPQTARFVCTKIARHFVADDPPPALVARLEAAWTSSNGDLAKVAGSLGSHAAEVQDALRVHRLELPGRRRPAGRIPADRADPDGAGPKAVLGGFAEGLGRGRRELGRPRRHRQTHAVRPGLLGRRPARPRPEGDRRRRAGRTAASRDRHGHRAGRIAPRGLRPPPDEPGVPTPMNAPLNLSRRGLLATAAGFGLSVQLLAVPAVAADSALNRKKVIVVICRGGMDGLSVAPPIGDSDYRSLRGGLALNETALPLDGPSTRS